MTNPHDPKGLHPRHHAALAAAALVLLVALPATLEAPQTPLGIAAAAIVAVLLVAAAVTGIRGFLRHRRRAFADSVLPPPADPSGGTKKDKPEDLYPKWRDSETPRK